MAWVLLACAVLLLLELIPHWAYVRLARRQFEAEPPFNVSPFDPDPTAEQVTTVTVDGIELRGSLHRGTLHQPRGLVLFCPEVAGSHWSAGWYCEGLLHAGFDVLAFDFRNQGESAALPGYKPTHWPTQHEVTDVNAALAFIQSRADLRDLPLVMMGISRGSLVALHTAAHTPQVRAVVGEGTYTVDSLFEYFTLRWAQLYLPRQILRWIPMWHLRWTLRMARWSSAYRRNVQYLILEPSLRRLKDRPVLLIAGERDNYVPPTIVRAIAERINSGLCRVWSVPRCKHNQGRTVAREEYDQTVEQFLGAVCPLPQTDAVTPAIAEVV